MAELCVAAGSRTSSETAIRDDHSACAITGGRATDVTEIDHGARRADGRRPSAALAAGSEAERLEFREVQRSNWGDLERLFESRGSPKHCWCMLWRATPQEARQRDNASRKAALQGRVEAGVPVGLLGYADGEPLAWCSIAPRGTYRRLDGYVDPADDPERVWSLACLFLVRRLRGTGALGRVIQAAALHARSRGAAILEAYPVEPDSPSYRFMGFVPVFAAAGFQEVGRAGKRRHVMRLRLDAPQP